MLYLYENRNPGVGGIYLKDINVQFKTVGTRFYNSIIHVNVYVYTT